MVSVQERERRYAALRQAMRQAGYQALVIAGNAEATQRGYIRYVSDWRLWGGTGYVVLPLENDPILILGSGSQAHWAKAVGWIQEVRSALDMIGEVIAIVQALGLGQSQIGVVGLNQVMAYENALRLMKELPQARLEDASLLADRIMVIKSQEEIAQAAETYGFVAEALGRVKEVLKPGKTEREVMAEAIRLLAERGCFDGIAHLTNEAPPFIHPATERRIQADDIIKVSLEFAGPSGHWIELAGVYSFREPPARARRHFETTLRALEQAKSLMRPGAKAGEISRAIEQTYREEGWNITGRAIWDMHAIGLNVIRPPIGLPTSQDEFQENMVINIHPGLLVDEDQWGIYAQDNLVVTPEGARPLAEYKYEWHVLPA
ncbi:MAG: M24 family metallopeptidase [Anaerolineae bacterium]